MKYAIPSYRIFPLGDQALVIDFGNRINENLNNAVISLFELFQSKNIPGLTDLVPAYSSLALFYDAATIHRIRKKEQTAYQFMEKLVRGICESLTESNKDVATIKNIGVCYNAEFAPDMGAVCAHTGLDEAAIINLHTSVPYRVYMLGFLPGFAYMGETHEQIAVPRKKKPAEVQPGSVGLAGRQTGIYPFTSPGGWQIIGRTPVSMFDASSDTPSFFQSGDLVKFYSITPDEFKNY